MKTKGGSIYRCVTLKGVLYREFKQVRGQTSNTMKEVLPADHRKRVMNLAHGSIVGGHLAAKKTMDFVIIAFTGQAFTVM